MIAYLILSAACYILTAGESQVQLRSALSNTDDFIRLYSQFRRTEHKSYPAAEARFRARTFRKTLKMIVKNNADETSTFRMGLNQFSDMTAEEMLSYTGANFTLSWDNEGSPMAPARGNPESKDWRGDAVTPVKNQGRCGSGWVFAAVGGLEGQYKAKAGNLKTFSEQEPLDCVKENGCRVGGTPDEVYDWLKTSGRIASASDVPYKQVNGACNHKSKANALAGFKVAGYTKVSGDDAHITALATKGPLAVTFSVTRAFYSYFSGIFTASSCSGPAHAVTSVGYGKNFFIMKNQWGSRWGENGFFRIGRGNVCGISNSGRLPLIEAAKEE